MFSRAFMLLVVACIQRTCQDNSEPLTAELPLTKEDQRFCRGELELNYPDVDIRSCMIIPQEFREKISREWGPPQVRLATANTETLENEAKAAIRQERIKFIQRKSQYTEGERTLDQKKYVLMMVDPDAPSRTDPTRAHWRHWLLADVEGSSLGAGDIKGTLLSEYTRPTPPKQTGFHRYQFLLYEQPTGQVLSLSQQEQSSLGNWDPQAFVEKFGLVGPVASLQFLTQHFKD